MFQIQSKNGLKATLLLGAATALGLSMSASAAPVETVVVTGSRIPQAGLNSSSPVTSIGSREMKFEGTTSIDTLISSLPAATADYNAVSSAFSGALGTANVNLRSLGSSRTLVLIDGKRLQPGDPILPVADLNQIPAALVDHVEVLTGGASAIYGSDAVAGVVNFVMRRDFEGIEFDGQFSINQTANTGSTHGVTFAALNAAVNTPPVEENWWGGQTHDANVVMGVNTDNGKGNITAWLGFRNVQPVFGSERDFANCSLGTNFVDHLNCQGSSNLNRWISFDNLIAGLPQSQWDNFQTGTGAPGSGAFVPYTGAATQKFNFGAPAYLQQPSVRYTAGFDAHYEVTPWAEAYANLMFADSSSTTIVSPTAVFLGAGPANFPGSLSPGYLQINCSNPLMTLQENQRLCGLINPGGIGGDQLVGGRWNGAANVTPGLALLQIGRRDVEDAGRVYDTRHTSYRMVIGVKGDISDGWTYDAFAQYGMSLFNFETTNDWSKMRVENALNVDPVTGQCFSVLNNSDPNCVPLDLFNGFGAISPAAKNYISLRGFETGYTEEQVIGATVTGDLGKYGFQTPWSKSPISVAFGVEYRAEYLRFNVDTSLATGDSYGNGGKILEVPRSGFNVKEFFGEVAVPLIQDMPFARELTLKGGYRYSDYSSVGGIHSYKFGLVWAPDDNFRFRAGIDRATRAPNVLEAFTPNNIVLFSGQDPCSTSTAGLCAGVPNAGTAILACPATQCNNQTGGNPSLVAETADTKTFGLVFTPTFFDHFNMTIDYFDIKVDDYVGTYGAQTILNGCLTPGASAAAVALYCPLIHRAGSGAIYGAGYVENLNRNLPFIKTSGMDFEANYLVDFDDWGWTGHGTVALNFIGTWTKEWSLSPSAVSDPASYDCAGLFGVICGSPYPTWKHKARVTWSSPWDVDLSLGWRFIGSTNLDVNTTDPLLGGAAATACPGGITVHGAGDCVDNTIDAFNYFDLSAIWNVTDGVSLRGGINNLFDKQPPVLDQGSLGVTPIPFGAANTFPGTYDSLGRNIFIGGTVKL